MPNIFVTIDKLAAVARWQSTCSTRPSLSVLFPLKAFILHFFLCKVRVFIESNKVIPAFQVSFMTRSAYCGRFCTAAKSAWRLQRCNAIVVLYKEACSIERCSVSYWDKVIQSSSITKNSEINKWNGFTEKDSIFNNGEKSTPCQRTRKIRTAALWHSDPLLYRYAMDTIVTKWTNLSTYIPAV